MIWPRSTLVEHFTARGFAKLSQGTVPQEAPPDFEDGKKGLATLVVRSLRIDRDASPPVPRSPRGQQDGSVYHVIDRGRRSSHAFHQNQDNEASVTAYRDEKRHLATVFGLLLNAESLSLCLETV